MLNRFVGKEDSVIANDRARYISRGSMLTPSKTLAAVFWSSLRLCYRNSCFSFRTDLSLESLEDRLAGVELRG